MDIPFIIIIIIIIIINFFFYRTQVEVPSSILAFFLTPILYSGVSAMAATFKKMEWKSNH